MSNRRNYALLALLLFTQSLVAQPAWIRDSLDIYIARSMQTEQVPGLAIAVVQDGKVVLQRTYGVLETGKASGLTLKVNNFLEYGSYEFELK